MRKAVLITAVMIFVFSFFLLLKGGSLAQIRENHIGQKTFHFYDEKRNRVIITEVWYPTNDSLKESDRKYSPFVRDYTVREGKPLLSNYPLIMISHGLGGGRLSLEWIAQSLVRNKFIVAAVDHWGNTHDNPIAIEFIKPWERPLDISFALSNILRNDFLKGVIDKQNIGALGYSFGGYTVIALAGGIVNFEKLIGYYTTIGKKEAATPQFPELWQLLLTNEFTEQTTDIPRLKDDRIKAFFAICPGTGPGFVRKEQFNQVNGSNVFIVGAAGDSIAPVEQYARNFHKLIEKSVYYEFSGKVGHFVILNEAKEELRKEDPGSFMDDSSVNRREVHFKLEKLFLNFFSKRLKR